MPTKITTVVVKDIRFPTSLEADGSDAMHPDPDYSCAYVIIYTNSNDGIEGHGPTFTIGRGTEVVVAAIEALKYHLIGQDVHAIFDDFGGFWKKLTSDSQLRWIGPEKGVIHLATAAIMNALWDLWAKREKKPLWKLLVDMDPEKLLSCIDFTYISDCITKEEALEILKKNSSTKQEREIFLKENGFPAYTTSSGWLGYSDEKIQKKCQNALKEGWTMFKMKVGANLEDDKRRAKLIRQEIGYDKALMMDSNQRWGVQEAIDWMKQLAEFKPKWIEEPTSPDDVLGHAAIAKALNPLGIGVATGEHCQNRVLFKQFLQSGGMQYCQIDSCRIGGVNEILSVLLMAQKCNVPVCPHAGGVLLCELVQHLIMFHYICISASLENSVCEYVEHLRENFKYPVKMKGPNYLPPTEPGYSTQLTAKAIEDHVYPNGRVWEELRKAGKINH